MNYNDTSFLDKAPDTYGDCLSKARDPHGENCPGGGACTCGKLEATKAVAYARGENPTTVDCTYEI